MLQHTPVLEYRLAGRVIKVKREDLCVPEGWPPFSKMRGVYAYLSRRRDEGLRTVGYNETTVSMAGWGLAACCKHLGMQAVIFKPTYKGVTKGRVDLKLLEYHAGQWQRLGATVIPIQATRMQINYYKARGILASQFADSEMLPMGLPFEETIVETAKEWRATMEVVRPAVTVLCAGSGTVLAGVLRGREAGEGRVIAVLVRGTETHEMWRQALSKAKRLQGGLLGKLEEFKVVGPGWEYTEPSYCACPFPCHPFYDLKAWHWLKENIVKLPDPVLFWNIGSSPVKLPSSV